MVDAVRIPHPDVTRTNFMVSVILRGGLGNQLFQYATGRAHALRTGSDLSIYLSRLQHDSGSDVAKRSLQIDAFELPVEYVGGGPTFSVGGWSFERISRIVASIDQSLAVRLFNLYVEDQTLTFDPVVLELPGDITLDGYWQSERYFDEFAETLRHEISVSDPVSGVNRQWYDRISSANSVSVHVRRGDYVSLGWALPPEYYRDALNRIRSDTGATDLFFFSDDMDWVRTHKSALVADNDYEVHFVECNDGETAHEDLRLMRSCDHHVIANSSFSWWGAWLDDSETKHVVAPDYWVHDSVEQLDIVPDRWTTVGW